MHASEQRADFAVFCRRNLCMKSFLMCVFMVLAAPVQDSVEEMLLGKWMYTKGTYEYYDADNHKLKESEMNAISNFEIQLNKDNTAVISLSRKRRKTTTYSVSKNDNGRYVITADLSGNPFKYEISSISPTNLVLFSKTSSSFFIDGDVTKKVSYCLIKIYLDRKT
jgi:hypothetical protein